MVKEYAEFKATAKSRTWGILGAAITGANQAIQRALPAHLVNQGAAAGDEKAGQQQSICRRGVMRVIFDHDEWGACVSTLQAPVLAA